MEKPPFWTFTSDELLKELTTESSGLTQEEAEIRIKMYGANLLKQRKSHSNLALFLAQFKSPIILILIFAPFAQADSAHQPNDRPTGNDNLYRQCRP